MYNISSPCILNTAMLLFTFIEEPYALHDILVLLLSFNALANNTLLTLPPLRVNAGCWINPLLKTSPMSAELPFTWMSTRSAKASQVKLTVELRVVLTDWGWTVISVKKR